MSCCGSSKPGDITPDATLRSIIEVLRTRRNALRGGDGFSHAGTLIGAYKRSIAQLEALLVLVETAPEEEAPKGDERPNPECSGRFGENVPTCQCKTIADRLAK